MRVRAIARIPGVAWYELCVKLPDMYTAVLKICFHHNLDHCMYCTRNTLRLMKHQYWVADKSAKLSEEEL